MIKSNHIFRVFLRINTIHTIDTQNNKQQFFIILKLIM